MAGGAGVEFAEAAVAVPGHAQGANRAVRPTSGLEGGTLVA